MGDGLLQLSKDAYHEGDKAIGSQSIALAIQRGNAAAKLEMAKWYDPRTVLLDRVNGIDTNKAARSYFELALGGNAEAKTLLTSLCGESRNANSTYASNFNDFLKETYCEGSLGD